VDPERAAAERLDVEHAVRAEQQRAAVAQVALEPCHALLLERLVADGEHLVGDEQLRRHHRRDRETQAHDHARRVVLHRLVDLLADVGEIDDALQVLLGLPARQSHQRARQVDVLAAGVLGMEAAAELEQRPYPAVHLDRSAGRAGRRPR
jgi:predicted NAD/FAD-dependent oxidoreductase